ncbi:MAG: 2-C-methyl-D-erythritol 2,4-cyclodiphosphate synthase, partial [Clostridia bacterium]|nr:2-C-methyl-D-erythritol 2,4-cyclodiphosphate synthase [Clostridia bacterium]
QGFLRKELLSAYEQAFADGRQFTDESGVYGEYIAPPRLFMGERSNKKLTYPEDFQPAERVGFGVDTHAFYAECEGMPFINFITLGGVRIPSEKILKAHSDGDVLVHALMDALLSAKGLRDIGYYFPDTDEKYKGANSMELLGEVIQMTGKPKNVSISILAETPRLAPYIEEMKKSLSSALGIPEENIGIAAGTNERLGYIGEKKGITVYATVLL